MRHNRLGALVGLLAASCGGAMGPSCGGCAPANYTYPSKVMQGTEMVDDAVRARMTERGLDFLAANFKEILRQQFPPDAQNPNVSRITLPSQAFTGGGGGLIGGAFCLQGNTMPPPAGCETPLYTGKTSAVLLDLTNLEDQITMDFITTPEPGVRVTARGLKLGLDARMYGQVSISVANTDAQCDLVGATSLPNLPMDTLGTIDMVAEIYPRVSTSPAECQMGAPQCFMASVVVTEASINGVGLAVRTPPKCTGNLDRDFLSGGVTCRAGGCTPAGCAPGCSDGPIPFLGCDSADACFSNLTCPDSQQDCECRSLLCPALNFGADLIGQIADFLFTVLEPFLDNILTTALTNALAGFNGTPLSFNGQMDIASFAGGQVPALASANALGFSVAPTNAAFQVTCPTGTASCDERRGMDFYLKAGVEAVHDPANKKPAPAECVQVLEGARFLQFYQQAAFEAADGAPLSGEFLDQTTNMPKVYDLAASISRATLNQMGFAIYNGGVLCLALDSYAVHALTNGAFGFTVGALDLLTSGRLAQYADPAAPIYLALAPEEPATFTLGAGTMMDPHIQLSMKKLRVSVYVYMYERYARLFEVATDVGVGLNITPNPMTRELSIAVANGITINNFTQLYNELMPDVDFASILPSLLDVALGALLNQDISFNFDVAPLLSDALGGAPIYVVFEALQTERVNNRGEFINLYLSLSNTNPNPVTVPVLPQVQAASDPGTWMRLPDGTIQATGRARLTGPLGQPLPQDHRYSARVDFGPWTEWVAPDDAGILHVMDAKLALVGQHTLQVRGMKVGQASTISTTPQQVTVWTDAAAPRVWLNRMEGRVAVRAEDRAAPQSSLRMRWALDQTTPGDWEGVRDLLTSELAGDVLTVEVRDPAGNVAVERLALRDHDAVLARANVNGVGSSSQGCVCAVPGSDVGATGSLAALAMLGMLLRVRRRR